MFVRKMSATYSWPVKHQYPVDGGKFETVTFDVVFKRLSDSKLKEYLKDEALGDKEFCREIVVGWSGIMDESKQELPFSQANLESLLDDAGFAGSVANAYLMSVSSAKAKN